MYEYAWLLLLVLMPPILWYNDQIQVRTFVYNCMYVC